MRSELQSSSSKQHHRYLWEKLLHHIENCMTLEANGSKILLFLGSKGVGKKKLVRALCDYVYRRARLGLEDSIVDPIKDKDFLDRSSSKRADTFQKEEQQSYDDLSIRAPVSLEVFRQFKTRFAMKQEVGKWRAVALLDVDEFSEAATQGLLHLTETSPDKTFLFLSSSGPIAQSLRSRCLVVRVPNIDDEQFTDYSISVEDSLSQWMTPYRFKIFSRGCIGRSKTVLQEAPWIEDLWKSFEEAQKGIFLPAMPQLWTPWHLQWLKEMFFLWAQEKNTPSSIQSFPQREALWDYALILFHQWEIYHLDAYYGYQALLSAIFLHTSIL